MPWTCPTPQIEGLPSPNEISSRATRRRRRVRSICARALPALLKTREKVSAILNQNSNESGLKPSKTNMRRICLCQCGAGAAEGIWMDYCNPEPTVEVSGWKKSMEKMHEDKMQETCRCSGSTGDADPRACEPVKSQDCIQMDQPRESSRL